MSASCEHCDSPAAALRCPQCAATLCDSCSAVIHAEGRFRQHTPGPVGETADIPRKTRPSVTSAPPAGSPAPPVVTHQQQQQQQPTLSPMPVNQMFPGQSFTVRRGPVKDDLIKVVPTFAAKAQEVRRAKQCERCEEVAATVTCKECDSDYCAECTQLVHGEGKFAQHTVGPVAAPSAATSAASPVSSSKVSPVRAPARASPLSPEPAATWGSVKGGAVTGGKRTGAPPASDSDSEDDFLEKPASPVFGCGRECKHDHHHHHQTTTGSPTRVPPTTSAPTPQLPKNRPVADDSDSEDDEGPARSAAELVAKIRSKQEMMQTKRLAYHEERKQRLRDSADTLLNKLVEGSSRRWTDTQLDVLRQAGPIQLSGCAEKVAHGVAIDIALTQLYAAQLRRLQSRESGPTPKDVLGKQYADLQRCVTDLNKLIPN